MNTTLNVERCEEILEALRDALHDAECRVASGNRAAVVYVAGNIIAYGRELKEEAL